MRVVDCQGFAGGFTLGAVQAGFELVAKKELPGAFGAGNCEVNRHLLGDKWELQESDGAEWEPVDAALQVGNPPCSGFSLMSRKDFRGMDSPINECMWAFAGYVARTRPEIAIFESVQPAYKQGAELMRALHAHVEERSGERWFLHHVLHNAASLGGAAIRKRYFWLVSRVPFGIEVPEVTRVPMLHEVIGDLEGLALTWERQPYRRPPSWWSRSRRRHAVDGHMNNVTPMIRRAVDLTEGVEWNWKESISTVFQRYYETYGEPPDSWRSINWQKIVDTDFHMGFHQLSRWHPHRVARVVTGGALEQVLHPSEPRGLTHREVARIQGFPDDWLIRPLRRAPGLRQTWGKGIPTDCGRWIAGWARRAIEGDPGSHPGEQLDEREYVIDVTNVYRSVCSES